MSKKPLSDMSSRDFVRIVAALGGSYGTVAKGIERSTGMVSLYASGKRPIPQDVADRLRNMINERKAEFERLGHIAAGTATIDNMIVVSNTMRQARDTRPGRMPALCRRSLPEDSRIFPAYRFTHARLMILSEALANYTEHITAARRVGSDIRDSKLYDAELADLRVLTANASGLASKGAPYDIHITFSEWNVVSRALRHAGTAAARSLYQHWRHHKGAGFPRA